MHRKSSDFIDCGIEEDIDPKFKFNSLLSVTVSTIMCLAAKCPLPKSNVETTKLFLSTIMDDYQEIPRNVKNFLTFLNDYSGPFEGDLQKETSFEKPPRNEKITRVVERCESVAKTSLSQVITREGTPVGEIEQVVKRSTKTVSKKSEKDSRKIKTFSSKILPSKSTISKF